MLAKGLEHKNLLPGLGYAAYGATLSHFCSSTVGFLHFNSFHYRARSLHPYRAP